MTIISILGVTIFNSFTYISLQTTMVINSTLMASVAPVMMIGFSWLIFRTKTTTLQFTGIVLSLLGAFAIVLKGNLNNLYNLYFTSGDLWMIGAAIGWAVYSIFLINWKSSFSLMARFTLIAFFGVISLFPFYLIEEWYFFNTAFNNNFIFWVLFAAISPGIIAFTLYTKVQKYVGASLAGFTLYIFSIYSAIYGIILFDEAILSFHYYGAALVFIGVYLARKIFK